MSEATIALLVGTKKGLYILRSDAARARWTTDGPFADRAPVYHASFDPRDNASMFLAANATWGGPRIELSRDRGRTWTPTKNPAFPAGGERTFARTWHIAPGHAATPDLVWAGTEPAALFRSDDRGESWTLVRGLDDQPTRAQWVPGNGGLGLHSIAVDAVDARRISVGISAGGVYTSTDGGGTWAPDDLGFQTEDGLGDVASVTYCIHKLVAHPRVAGLRFVKVHDHPYWREPGAAAWSRVTEGLPRSFGFAAAIHPHDGASAYLVPLDDRQRLAPPPGIAVWRTRDRGRTWTRHAAGLPAGAPMEVLREGLSTDRLDPAGVYFGTANGEVWGSADEGATWSRLAQYLPYVLSVHAATIAPD